ncbi:MAG: hypothetical protein M1820_007517 [Bogoriella megaspora]|nr:MAG: hypothetical protein M1820_007517 [Bogoriella megaspora]
MFEPLSVLGAVGTTAGLLGFLCTTIKNLDETSEVFQECQTELLHYKFELQYCEKLLRNWVTVWCKDDRDNIYPLETLECFWSAGGFSEICERIECIRREVHATLRLLGRKYRYQNDLDSEQPRQPPPLRRRKQHNHPDRNNWDQTISEFNNGLSSLDDVIRRAEPFPPSIAYKIAFALYGNRRFKKKIKRLRHITIALREYSQSLFWEFEQDSTGNIRRDVTQDMLQKRNETRIELQLLSTLLRRLYEAHDARWNQSALVLRPPDMQGDVRGVKNRSGITFDCMVGESSELGPESVRHIMRIATTDFNSSDLPSVEMLQYSYIYNQPSATEQLTITASQSLKDDLLRNFETLWIPSPDVRKPRRCSLQQRINIAKSVVNWTIILWNSPWTACICSCRIKLLATDNGHILPILHTVSQHNHCIHEQRSSHIYSTDFETNFFTVDNRRLLLLGVILAEIAVKQAILVSVSLDLNLSFELTDGTILDIDCLLQEVRSISGSFEFREAVRACFNFDKRYLARPLLPQDLDRYYTTILKPLEQFSWSLNMRKATPDKDHSSSTSANGSNAPTPPYRLIWPDDDSGHSASTTPAQQTGELSSAAAT